MSINYEFEHEVESVVSLLTDPNFLVERCRSVNHSLVEAILFEIDG